MRDRRIWTPTSRGGHKQHSRENHLELHWKLELMAPHGQLLLSNVEFKVNI